MSVNVHANHCCILHGCKYADPNCPVVREEIDQRFSCPDCWDLGIDNVDEVRKVHEGEIRTCNHCGHVIPED